MLGASLTDHLFYCLLHEVEAEPPPENALEGSVVVMNHMGFHLNGPGQRSRTTDATRSIRPNSSSAKK